jgi:hypothetical protein
LTRDEKQLLREEIRQIIKHNQFSWRALKREIWDLGYQSYYESQGKFFGFIEKIVFNLHPDKKNKLLQEWQDANPKREEISFSNFQAAYTLLILEEIIERARFGAMRTVHWDNQL